MKSRMKDYPTSLSTPIDSTAGKVTSQGEHFEPTITGNFVGEIWDTKPPTIPYYESKHRAPSLMGEKKGRLEIVGYLGDSKWVARCTCGLFVVRRANTWRKNKCRTEDRCAKCRAVEKLLNRS